MSSTGVRIGVADHLGWAVVVTVSTGLAVIDRRRIELVGPGLPVAPVHHEGGAHELHRTGEPLTDEALAELVERVRASAATTIAAELERLAGDLPGPVRSLSLREWPADFPTDIARRRVAPYESRADPVMYRQELAAAATALGWPLAFFDGRSVESQALGLLSPPDPGLLERPRTHLGPRCAKDHRLAYAAVVLAERADGGYEAR